MARLFSFPFSPGASDAKVEIVNFPDTAVKAPSSLGLVRHGVRGARAKLIQWRRANHDTTGPAQPPTACIDLHQRMRTGYRIDICVAFTVLSAHRRAVIVAKLIPGGRCAFACTTKARVSIPVVGRCIWVATGGGERAARLPPFFHYVNVGTVWPSTKITDGRLPAAQG